MNIIKILLLSLLCFGLFYAPSVYAEYQVPTTFTSCHNPVGSIKADYPTGQHAIVGVIGLKNGSDKVFAVGSDNYTQCYCPTEGNTGVKTNWLAAGNIPKEDQNVLITQGWVYISNGADWGLSQQPYLAKNIEFSCSGGDRGGDGGTSGGGQGGGGGTSGGGEVLGISTLANTSSDVSKYQILLTILLSVGLIAYGYKIQKNA
jgi:uncharacterized membrane protein YgcG